MEKRKVTGLVDEAFEKELDEAVKKKGKKGGKGRWITVGGRKLFIPSGTSKKQVGVRIKKMKKFYRSYVHLN